MNQLPGPDGIINLFRFNGSAPLLFHNGTFLVLFTLFFTGYAFLYRFRTARMVYLLLFSLFFYYKSSGLYLGILLFTIVFDYLIAIAIVRVNNFQGKMLVLISLVVNLGLLAYFKYFNFLLSNFTLVTGHEYPLIDLVLPIGISFYTFQTISYVIDVYRRKIEPANNLLEYAFYMTFFPHLVAGPIVRAADFLPQLSTEITLTKEGLNHGLYQIFKGLIKKAIIADYIAQYADLIYDGPARYSPLENLLAMYCYTLQIYCDFSGYSDMAIGLAALMGYKLCENFNSPYRSQNITEFWQRWHISLSSWLRDYLYIPLGGNRHGLVRQQINQLITMLLGGLWHGANWKFVVWGGLHGLALAGHKLYRNFTKPWPALQNHWALVALGWLLTFHFAGFLWVFFRAGSYSLAMDSLRKVFSGYDMTPYIVPFWRTRRMLVIVMILGYTLVFTGPKIKEWLYERFGEQGLIIKGLLFIMLVHTLLQLSSQNVQPFIYFQF